MKYQSDLEKLKKDKSTGIPDFDIISILLSTGISKKALQKCDKEGIIHRQYSPEWVLEKFYATVMGTKFFYKLKPDSIRIDNFYVNNMLYYLYDNGESTFKELVKANVTWTDSKKLEKPEWYLREIYSWLVEQFALSKRKGNRIELTDLGRRYVETDPTRPKNLSEEQAKFIRRNIIENPFATGVFFGIYSIVESIFELSKNEYPVKKGEVLDYFMLKIGRTFDWRKSHKERVFRRYAIFAELLGLIGIAKDRYYLTPTGLQFIIKLQLHRAMQLIDAYSTK